MKAQALNIKAANEAHLAAISLLENMKQSQEGLMEIGLLEDKDRAQIPQKPTLMVVGFAMAQKALDKIEHHNRNRNQSTGISLHYALEQSFREAGKALDSMPSDEGMTMLSSTLDITEKLKTEASPIIEFLTSNEIAGAAANIKQQGSFEYDLSLGANSKTIGAFESKAVMAERIYEAMLLSDVTNSCSKTEIQEALESGEHKGDLFTVKTLKAGVKLQLTKSATDAIKATIDNIKEVHTELEGICNRAKKEIQEAMSAATKGALTNEEYIARIEQAFKARLAAKRLSKAS